MCSRRHHNQCVDRLRDGNVFNRRVNVRLRARVTIEHAGNNFSSGEGGEGERTNEFLSGVGHDDLNTNTAVLQQADDLCGLVGCNTAANSEGNFHAVFAPAYIGYRSPREGSSEKGRYERNRVSYEL